MQLKRMRVKNFSSFKETDWINFFTRNQSYCWSEQFGKSALLRVLDQNLEDNRHRNAGQYRPGSLEPPSIDFDLDVSGREIEDAVSTWLEAGGSISWPVQTDAPDTEREKLPLFLSEPSHILELRRTQDSRPAVSPRKTARL